MIGVVLIIGNVVYYTYLVLSSYPSILHILKYIVLKPKGGLISKKQFLSHRLSALVFFNSEILEIIN